MDFGFPIPARGHLSSAENIHALATHGEALGFAYVAIPDHVVIPRAIASPYPYNRDRRMTGAESGDCMEPLALMAWLAAATTRIRLLTSVMVVPHRPPVLAAKMLATIDVLSRGRVTVGCGAGWMAEEFAAIGAPPFRERGKVTDEYLAIFRELWTADAPRFAGRYASFEDISFLPRPVQKPHPPLWIGGESPAALRRAARVGDAWYPIGVNPEFPLDSIERYRAAVARLREEAERIGRDPSSIELAYWANWSHEARGVTNDAGQRQLLTGDDAAVVADLAALREAGVAHCLVNFQRETLGASLDSMARFAADIVPQLG